ncbi:MAG: hypothetical protein JXA99_04025 [Candidatus Lokiarchaeota archaeon]|nr:hypothetical protein [Candidatus Lokiarchaeota archaeon]
MINTKSFDKIRFFKQVVIYLIITNFIAIPFYFASMMEGFTDALADQNPGSGQPFIYNNYSNISIINTNILFNMDTSNIFNVIDYYIEANYTIHNFNSENKTIMLISPFPSFFGKNYNITLKIDDQKIPYNYSDVIYTTEPNNYIYNCYNRNYDNYTAIVCNMTIPNNNNITLCFNLQSSDFTVVYLDVYFIYYDLYTNPDYDSINSTGSFTYQVYGNYPKTGNPYNYTIEEEDTYRNYKWEWNNELIYTPYFEIYFDLEVDPFLFFLNWYIPYFIILNVILIGILLIRIILDFVIKKKK